MKKAILVSIAALSLAACAKRQIIDPCVQIKKEMDARISSLQMEHQKSITYLTNEIEKRNERLSKFNQIDGQGNLRSNTWKSDPNQAPLTGNEPWMK